MGFFVECKDKNGCVVKTNVLEDIIFNTVTPKVVLLLLFSITKVYCYWITINNKPNESVHNCLTTSVLVYTVALPSSDFF